nr:putative reverse transcriptase domain-containing protein [Tanacetum cinerariifolium]
FHVSNLKKYLANPTLQVPLDKIRVDAKLNFMEEPMEILDREFKKLKGSRIAIVKVRWNLKRGPEFTWERQDQMKLKYPHLLSDINGYAYPVFVRCLDRMGTSTQYLFDYWIEWIMSPRMKTRSAGRPATEILGGGTGVRVGRGGRGRRPREEGANEGAPDFSTIICPAITEPLTRHASSESMMIERYVYGLASQIRGMVAATKPKTIQKAVQISGALTDEAVRNGYIKKVEKKGNMREPSKDKSGRDDNKRTMTRNVFATTVNLVGRENTGLQNVNPVNARNPPVRACYECGSTNHVRSACPRWNRAQGREETIQTKLLLITRVKVVETKRTRLGDYRGVPRNVNPVNARNPPVRACYGCGSTDHVRSACLRLNREQGQEGNHPNQVVANNGVRVVETKGTRLGVGHSCWEQRKLT